MLSSAELEDLEQKAKYRGWRRDQSSNLVLMLVEEIRKMKAKIEIEYDYDDPNSRKLADDVVQGWKRKQSTSDDGLIWEHIHISEGIEHLSLKDSCFNHDVKFVMHMTCQTCAQKLVDDFNEFNLRPTKRPQ